MKITIINAEESDLLRIPNIIKAYTQDGYITEKRHRLDFVAYQTFENSKTACVWGNSEHIRIWFPKE